ncbi:MAG: 16S rRNA (cytosine(1402)-N(4))-methyltransferase RsmH [Ruminococcaceae bacterium]|nr:16S rRNA (cytosine(1402)-N(4))-methyltransferase RsmH [Oscillospiraceae bacterium]
MEFKHISVLLEESVSMLNVKSDGIYVDGTLGGGGHSELIIKQLDGGRLIGIDQDKDAIEAASERLKPYRDRLTVVHRNFSEVKNILDEIKVSAIDGAILDLGVSSHQLDAGERGFSYNSDAVLDMRMNKEQEFSAYELVNTYSEEDLKRIIYAYGEERFAPQIARMIVSEREKKPIKTTFELSDLIKRAMPKSAKYADKHPAKRTFQAIRIEVNRELEILEKAIRNFVSVLKPGGVLAIITFHSLEDRIVKTVFNDLTSGCECPKSFPICVCNKKPIGKPVNKKPIISGREELEMNNRAHSAKLRGIIKL